MYALNVRNEEISVLYVKKVFFFLEVAMIVNFRSVSNQLYTLELQPTDTVASIKATLAEKYNFHPKKIRLIYKAKVLADTTTIESAGIDGNGFVVVYAMQAPQQNNQTNNSSTNNKENEVEEENNKPNESKPHQPPLAQRTVPEPKPLPVSTGNFHDPPGFRKKVDELQALGFSRGDCEIALRAAVGNVDRAADYLLSGRVPDVPQMISVSDVPMKQETANNHDFSDEENEEVVADFGEEEQDDPMNGIIDFRDELIRHPEKLRSFLHQMAEDNPEIAYLIRDDPSAFLASIGFNPNDFDLTGLGRTTQYEQLMSEFNEKEQRVIHNLEKLGFDTMTIIQVFVACEKDEEMTRSCLESMM